MGNENKTEISISSVFAVTRNKQKNRTMNDNNTITVATPCTTTVLDDHQNNMNIINNSTNKNHKENGYNFADSDISIISGNDYDNDQHESANHIKAKLATSTSSSSSASSPHSSKDNHPNKNNSHINKSTMNQITDTNREMSLNHNVNNHSITNTSKLNETQCISGGGQNMSQTSKHSLLPLMKKKIPINVLMGFIQLLLSITMVALACLSLAREATLANACSGLWAGAIAAITGALGIMNMARAKSAFLAMSLVCVASSTLALAITGIGVVRDSNVVGQDKV